VFAAEACIPFFGVYLGILSGNRIGLHTELAPFDPTVEEKEAFEKIQDCYEEEGLKAKTEDMKLMVMPSLLSLAHTANFRRLCTNDQCSH
jgi:hypothetical protein